MTKFVRFNIIWQRGAFLTAAVLGAEQCTFIPDTFYIREDKHPGLLFFRTSRLHVNTYACFDELQTEQYVIQC